MTSAAKGKALVAKLRANPKVKDAEALAANLGRRKKLRAAGISGKKVGSLAGKKGGMKEGGASSKSSMSDKGRKIATAKGDGDNGGVKEPPDHESGWNDFGGDSDITDKQASYLGSLRDKNFMGGTSSQFTGKRDKIPDHAVALNMPKPKNKREASGMIDDLRSGPLTYARNNPDFGNRVQSMIVERYGRDLSGFADAYKKRFDSLSPEQKEKAQESSQAMRRYVINPLLKL